MRGLEKKCMGRGQDTYRRTSRLLDRIGTVSRFGENPEYKRHKISRHERRAAKKIKSKKIFKGASCHQSPDCVYVKASKGQGQNHLPLPKGEGLAIVTTKTLAPLGAGWHN